MWRNNIEALNSYIRLLSRGEGRGKAYDGFTLIELLISLTILSIIVLMVFLGMRTGIRAWERGEEDIEMLQKRRIVLNLVQQQIASACTPGYARNTGLSCIFKGDDYKMAFVSVLSLIPGHKAYGPVEVEYKIEQGTEGGTSLLFSEKLIGHESLKNGGESFRGSDQSEPSYSLISGVKDISFYYCGTFSLADGALKWESMFNPQGRKESFPEAVKVCLKENDDQKPTCIIARIQQ